MGGLSCRGWLQCSTYYILHNVVVVVVVVVVCWAAETLGPIHKAGSCVVTQAVTHRIRHRIDLLDGGYSVPFGGLWRFQQRQLLLVA